MRRRVNGGWVGRAAAVAVGFVGVVGAGASPVSASPVAKAPDLIAHYKIRGVRCVPAPQGTVRAKVVVRMSVVNYDGFGGDWAQRMRLEARLVPTSAGHNVFRVWSEYESDDLLVNKRHSLNMWVVTDNVSSAADWKLQVRMIWDRPAGKDVVKSQTLKFSGECGGLYSAPQDGPTYAPNPA